MRLQPLNRFGRWGVFQQPAKADTLNSLKPIAFVDDYLPYFVGVDAAIHRALILRGITGSPNAGDLLVHTDSHHADLLAFANWWSQRAGDKCR